jgi:vanillate O-demethylase monooxygenase subunit
MTFLKDAWYCAGWAEELIAGKPIQRRLLGEPVLLYRREEGAPVALGDRCPHRFAPLHLGRQEGDNIACPYHGLVFGPDGDCVHNPHGDGAIPKAAKVARYPLVERWAALWIWMGDASRADPALIPDLAASAPRPGWACVRGYLEVPANYELVTDNLLDLSHVAYLHPFLTPDPATLPPEFREVRDLQQDGDTVWAMHCILNSPITPLLGMLWQDAPPLVEGYFDMRWQPPSNLLMIAGAAVMGSRREEGVAIPTCHLLTPIDEHRTHYFWQQGRNRMIDSKEVDEQIRIGISSAFKNEDEAMIAQCLELMGTSDLMSLKPVLLPGDAAALRARRILSQRIAAEQAGG